MFGSIALTLSAITALALVPGALSSVNDVRDGGVANLWPVNSDALDHATGLLPRAATDFARLSLHDKARLVFGTKGGRRQSPKARLFTSSAYSVLFLSFRFLVRHHVQFHLVFALGITSVKLCLSLRCRFVGA